MPLTLSPGRYKAVLKLSGVEQGLQFFDVISRTQPQGRTLFATPFKIRTVNTSQPETSVLNATSVFTLARYNPLRLPSDFDYALFQSSTGGRRDLAASFSATAPDGSALVYEGTDTATSIAPVGLGYWLNLDRSVTLNPVGGTATNSVSIRLFASGGGWNLIGAPFTESSAWGAATVIYRDKGQDTSYKLEDAVNAGIISSSLVGFREGDYNYSIAPNGLLEPFNGYWVRAYRDCTLVIAPAGTTNRSALVPVRNTVPTNSSGWRARLIASTGGDHDGQNYFGQTTGATNQNDGYDVPKPPSGAGHAYVRFLTPVGEGRSVPNAFDIRSLSSNEKQEWTAAVSTDRSGADVTLTWDRVNSAPRRATLTLVDPVTGQRVDMRSRSAYTFKSGEAGSTRKISIILNPTPSNGPLAITNVAVASGRGVGQTGLSVRFAVTAEAEIKGVIKSLSGATVGNLTGLSRAVGGSLSTLRWDGRSVSGAAVPPGPYLLEITAVTTDGQPATYKQPVQILR